MQAFAPHEVKALPSEVADHLRAHAIIPGTMRRARGELIAERYLAGGPGWTIQQWTKIPDITGTGNDRYVPEYVRAEPEADWGVVSTTAPTYEMAGIPNYADRAVPENRPTRIELVPV